MITLLRATNRTITMRMQAPIVTERLKTSHL
jgi:hypothetical protein